MLRYFGLSGRIYSLKFQPEREFCYISHLSTFKILVLRTEWAPARLMIGASRPLVRWTVLMSPLLRSSPDEEIRIWLDGGGVALALFTTVPSRGGEGPRFDILGGWRMNFMFGSKGIENQRYCLTATHNPFLPFIPM